MAIGYAYTREQLNKIDVDNLLNLASYFRLNVPNGIKKEDLITVILDASINPPEVYSGYSENYVPRYSVRVQRIMDKIARGEQP